MLEMFIVSYLQLSSMTRAFSSCIRPLIRCDNCSPRLSRWGSRGDAPRGRCNPRCRRPSPAPCPSTPLSGHRFPPCLRASQGTWSPPLTLWEICVRFRAGHCPRQSAYHGSLHIAAELRYSAGRHNVRVVLASVTIWLLEETMQVSLLEMHTICKSLFCKHVIANVSLVVVDFGQVHIWYPKT